MRCLPTLTGYGNCRHGCAAEVDLHSQRITTTCTPTLAQRLVGETSVVHTEASSCKIFYSRAMKAEWTKCGRFMQATLHLPYRCPGYGFHVPATPPAMFTFRHTCLAVLHIDDLECSLNTPIEGFADNGGQRNRPALWSLVSRTFTCKLAWIHACEVVFKYQYTARIAPLPYLL
jgi:hypothetical protein